MRLAADRGVTICFADLDGADGLWVPEERTVLVNRSLSEPEVAAVIEHELGHVAIDDQHAELDAGVGRPPPAATPRWAPAALTAAACLAVVVGVTLGLTRDPGGGLREDPVVAPTAPPLTAAPPGPGEVFTTSVVIGPDGRLQVRTVTLTATPSATTPAATSGGVIAPTATRTSSRPAPVEPTATTPAPTGETTSPPPEPEPTTPTPAPTTETPVEDPGDAGDEGDAVDEGDVGGGGSGSGFPPGTP